MRFMLCMQEWCLMWTCREGLGSWAEEGICTQGWQEEADQARQGRQLLGGVCICQDLQQSQGPIHAHEVTHRFTQYSCLSGLTTWCFFSLTGTTNGGLRQDLQQSQGPAHTHEVRKEKETKDYIIWRWFNEKPSIVPGCPGCIWGLIISPSIAPCQVWPHGAVTITVTVTIPIITIFHRFSIPLLLMSLLLWWYCLPRCCCYHYQRAESWSLWTHGSACMTRSNAQVCCVV